jgi:hypothetical protein
MQFTRQNLYCAAIKNGVFVAEHIKHTHSTGDKWSIWTPYHTLIKTNGKSFSQPASAFAQHIFWAYAF